MCACWCKTKSSMDRSVLRPWSTMPFRKPTHPSFTWRRKEDLSSPTDEDAVNCFGGSVTSVRGGDHCRCCRSSDCLQELSHHWHHHQHHLVVHPGEDATDLAVSRRSLYQTTLNTEARWINHQHPGPVQEYSECVSEVSCQTSISWVLEDLLCMLLLLLSSNKTVLFLLFLDTGRFVFVTF